MRTGALGPKIFKAPETFTPLRDSARAYAMVTKDVTRTKNRIKSFYRSRGVPTPGKKVFCPTDRSAALLALKPGTCEAVEVLCKQLDSVEEIKAQAQKAMIAQAHKHPITKKLETVPGLGPVRVAQLLAIVVSPHRFRTSRQFWAYCGLGIVMRSSADWLQTPDGNWVKAESVQTRGLNRNCNRIAKSIFKGAATTVLWQLHNNPLYEDYCRLLKNGTKPNLAKLTIARKIAAITLAIWKNKEAYNPAKYRKQIR